MSIRLHDACCSCTKIHSSSELVSNAAKWQLAHSISTFHTTYSDTGLMGVYAVAEPTTLFNLTSLIMDCLTTLSYKVDENQLNEAKTHLKTTLLHSLNHSDYACEEIGKQLLNYGRRIHPLEWITRIESVDAAAVKRAANRFFYDRDHVCAALGPIWELPDYNYIRSRSYFARF